MGKYDLDCNLSFSDPKRHVKVHDSASFGPLRFKLVLCVNQRKNTWNIIYGRRTYCHIFAPWTVSIKFWCGDSACWRNQRWQILGHCVEGFDFTGNQNFSLFLKESDVAVTTVLRYGGACDGRDYATFWLWVAHRVSVRACLVFRPVVCAAEITYAAVDTL